MAFIRILLTTAYAIGLIGNSPLFLYMEWTFLWQDVVHMFNPFLHLQILGVLLATPLFWVLLGVTVVALLGAKAAGNLEGDKA